MEDIAKRKFVEIKAFINSYANNSPADKVLRFVETKTSIEPSLAILGILLFLNIHFIISFIF